MDRLYVTIIRSIFIEYKIDFDMTETYQRARKANSRVFRNFNNSYWDFTPLESNPANNSSDAMIDNEDLMTKENERMNSNKAPIPIIDEDSSPDCSNNDENEFLGYRSDTNKSRLEESKSKRRFLTLLNFHQKIFKILTSLYNKF